MKAFSALFVSIAALTLGQPASASNAIARMHNPDGESVGTVVLHSSPYGVLLHLRLAFLPAGAHAFHVHAVGECTPPFTSAGGHFDPKGSNHGFMDDDGMHAGDMPNVQVSADGLAHLEVFNQNLRLDEALFDEDGASIVIHEGPDDYRSDPAGAAGPRLACGVIKRTN
ncbi:MAG: superoxide dismutase family protein [Xanthomonadales bacterium]|nr:superoxide dismutase family protein [Xanthomonadales bacterium]